MTCRLCDFEGLEIGRRVDCVEVEDRSELVELRECASELVKSAVRANLRDTGQNDNSLDALYQKLTPTMRIGTETRDAILEKAFRGVQLKKRSWSL